MTLKYETVNGSTTLEAPTALKMLLSLTEITYINLLLNEDIRETIQWLVDELPTVRNTADTQDVYVINEGTALIRVRYDDDVMVARMITGHMVGRIIERGQK